MDLNPGYPIQEYCETGDLVDRSDEKRQRILVQEDVF